MRKVCLLLLAAAITAGCFSVREAKADGNIIVHRTSSVGFGNNFGYGNNNWSWGPYSLNRSLGYIPTTPYYALHPPVYYSHNVAVPYGMSPYPISSYSPGASYAVERSIPEPQVVINPYVQAEEAAVEAPVEPSANDQAAMKIVDADGEVVAAQTPAIIDNSL